MHSELEQLQGSWMVTSLQAEGTTLSAAALGGAKIVVQGNNFTSLGMGATYKGRMTVDAATSPKTFTLLFTEGPEKGNTNRGIYELDGDTWKICLATTGGPAPRKFAATPGSGHALQTLRRQSEADVEQISPGLHDLGGVQGEPVPELEGEWSMVSCMRDGEPLEKMMVKNARRIIKGNETAMFFGPSLYMKARFTIESTEPKAIDFMHTEGPSVGKTQHGIYQRNGDTLKFCFAAPGHDRPGDYTATRGDGRTVTVWRFVKK